MVQWNAEKDQIILKGIFKFHDIKSSAHLLDYLANEIGEGCTPKAVSHRLNGIRNGGKSGGTRPNGSVTHTPTKATTPKTPRSCAKATPRKIKKTSEESDTGPEGVKDDDDEEIVSPSAARGQRGKRQSYAEPESEDDGYGSPMAKRVKMEPLDDDLDSSFDDAMIGDVEEFEV